MGMTGEQAYALAKKLIESSGGGTVDAYTKSQTDNLLIQKVDKNTISDYWDSSITYTVGQYCIYDNKLWKCLIQHSGQTPSDGTYWTQTSVDNEINELNSNFYKKSVRYGAYESDISLEQAILKHIDDMQEYVPYFIHGTNIGGLSISATNDVMIEVTRYGETGKRYNNWYRVMIYDNQSSGIFTITNIKGSWNGWKTIISST